MKLKGRDWWNLILGLLPLWAAYDASVGQYHYVNGQWVEKPFSVEDAVAGFLVGVVIAAVLFGLTIVVRAIWHRLKSN